MQNKEVTSPSAIQLLLEDDQNFVVRSTALVGVIGQLRHLESQRSNFYWGTIGLLPSDPHPGRSDRAPSSFEKVTPPPMIQLLLGDNWAFVVRSTVLIHNLSRNDRAPSSFEERSGTFVILRGDSTVSDPTFTWGLSSFYQQIHHSDRSDREPSSFGEVISPLAIQLLLRDDRTFVIRSTTLVGGIKAFIVWRGDSPVSYTNSIRGRLDFCRQIHRTDRSDQTSSFFEEVTPSSVIQLLLEDNQAFVVQSTALVGAIGTFVVWRGDSAVSDPTSTEGRSSSYLRSIALVGAIGDLHRLER
ncbi:hypothetical protein E6C27_scaffold2484G00100 [Cucumis melo var. makuwa]|uniref:Uncharacterized protein n=1 Tax=Cucumis melo var. makuwa TaxID=1194695 RepID=A0A5A7VKT4_CUCMM|nr:hypothetical protein E6C27_scaffold2484G00100 [Cucumis melo var. makuwa]